MDAPSRSRCLPVAAGIGSDDLGRRGSGRGEPSGRVDMKDTRGNGSGRLGVDHAGRR